MNRDHYTHALGMLIEATLSRFFRRVNVLSAYSGKGELLQEVESPQACQQQRFGCSGPCEYSTGPKRLVVLPTLETSFPPVRSLRLRSLIVLFELSPY